MQLNPSHEDDFGICQYFTIVCGEEEFLPMEDIHFLERLMARTRYHRAVMDIAKDKSACCQMLCASWEFADQDTQFTQRFASSRTYSFHDYAFILILQAFVSTLLQEFVHIAENEHITLRNMLYELEIINAWNSISCVRQLCQIAGCKLSNFSSSLT